MDHRRRTHGRQTAVQAQSETLTPGVLVPWTWAAASQDLDPFLDAALALN
ncbi:MAG: hypothetical protein HYX27_25260 [Acidobacteria bacterium]|nr:hypothetical protein [Acidobacteriota bacterium]